MAYIKPYTLPDNEHLIAALTTAKVGSFSAAALELNLTHAAISRRISAFENWAGIKLFDRHARGVTPTAAGLRVLSKTATALELISNLKEPRLKKHKLPVVRLAVTPSFARYWLFPRLKFLEGNPADVVIEILADLKNSNLKGGEVDLAIRYGGGNWRQGTEKKLFDDKLVPVLASQPRPIDNPRTAQELALLPLLSSGDNTNWKNWLENYYPGATRKNSDRLFQDYSLAMDAASCGVGVALWNQSLHSLDNRLSALDKFSFSGRLGYYLIRRSGDVTSPTAMVADRIIENCGCAV